MSDRNPAKTSAEIYRDLRSRLVSAQFDPGMKLRPEQLRADYGCAAATLRECLFRLSCEGFVDFVDQKGFSVPQTSHELLGELARVRILIEQEGVTLSIDRGDIEWEASLAAAHHKLAHIEGRMRQSEDLRPFLALWGEAEWRFHELLSAASGSRILREAHRTYFDRYRQHLVSERHGFGFRRGIVREHKAILDAALARDAELCRQRIRDHIMAGMTAGGPEEARPTASAAE